MPGDAFWSWLQRAANHMDTLPTNPGPGPLPGQIEDALADALEAGTLRDGGVVDELCSRHPSWATQIRATVDALLALDALTPGDSIGPYRIVRRLGQGGMGTVFLAEQREPVQREVALKVIRVGMDSASVALRFQQERQALAWMQHDGIARVFDCGTTERGQPYFVMEHVDGVPLTDYCDRERLSLSERLALMLQVCAAVTHAHQKGIVHRDLKPSNVLITVADDTARAKVIDFGLAKIVTGGDASGGLLTAAGAGVVGTPEYMAPEQADAGNRDIDTRADVYSLGVMLYELLTGALPVPSERLRANRLQQVGEVLQSCVPDRPSTCVGSRRDTAEQVAALRRSTPRALVRVLRSDLDWVVLKALEKERGRRYASAGALADDIQRFLAQEPVAAGPPGLGYRLQKLAQKHRGQVLAAVLVLLTLLGGAIATFVQYLRAEDQAHEAVLAKNEAQEVAGFLERQWEDFELQEVGGTLRRSLLARVEPAQSAVVEAGLQGINFSSVALETIAQSLFDRSLLTIERDFAGRPLMKARLLQSMASTLADLGLVERARAPQAEALAIRRRLLGDDDPQTLLSVHEQAALLHVLQRSDPIDQAGQPGQDEAEALYREALAGRRRVLGADDAETIVTQANLGSLLLEAGDWQRAGELFGDALDRARRTLGSDNEVTLACWGNLARLAYLRGEVEQVEHAYRQVLAGSRALLGPDDPGIVIPILNLGAFLQERGELDEALPLLEEARERGRVLLGDDHPTTLSADTEYACWLEWQGRMDEAGDLYRKVLADRRRVLPENHPEILQSEHNLAYWLAVQGEHMEAVGYYEHALEGRRQVLGDTHKDTLLSLNNLALSLQRLGQIDAAEECLREALAGRRQRLGPDHAETMSSLNNLAMLLQSKGELDEAIERLGEVVVLSTAKLGERDPKVLTFSLNYGYALYKHGDLEAAEGVFRPALELCREVLGPDAYGTVDATHLLAVVLVETQRFDDAVPLLEGAEHAAREVYEPARVHRLGDFLKQFGIALGRRAEPDFAAARERLTEAHELLVESRGPEHADTLAAVRALVDLQLAWQVVDPDSGHDAEAERWLRLLPDGR